MLQLSLQLHVRLTLKLVQNSVKIQRTFMAIIVLSIDLMKYDFDSLLVDDLM